MKIKIEKQQLVAMVVMTVISLIIGLCLPLFITPEIPAPAGIYCRPVCEDGTGGWYTFLLPEDWDGLVEIETLPDQHNAYTARVISVKDREEGGGTLFSFCFYPEGADLTILPMDELGIVETPDGTRYHFVFARPSDMQFAIDNVENYLAMQEQGPAIARTVEFREGYLFTPTAACGME